MKTAVKQIQKHVLHSSIPTSILYSFLIFYMRATRHANLTFLIFIILQIIIFQARKYDKGKEGCRGIQLLFL
jgi:hypothetical protein